ncbi:DMT family transporter [Oceanospirillum linum]|uniref:EamA domain-containing protein n=1 Tax=Oceanospirillum linum TaxID=966 RepID=A0A1T1HG94_OCELI|nr:DMT family transporter [Oceanospirillum linum]OOV88858.1 hypothetical protein BTA35_0205175 [Oceanospirillum linum]SEG50117.1 Threonine/homoserine efflux transporter RhtA [Oleiphilus messinensis]SMP23013.1 Threonine/homoserine efflux transporter RhtA [Oceanospirillum linum]
MFQRVLSVSPYWLLLLTTLFWAGNFVLGRAVHLDVPPIGLSFWRWLTALAIILPFAIPHWKESRHVIRNSWPILLTLSVFSVACFNTLIYIGLQTAPASNSILLQSACPVLILVISWLFFREKVTLLQGAGMMISLFGVVVVVTEGSPSAIVGMDFLNVGTAWILLAVLCWAIYSSLLRLRPDGLSPFGFFALTVLIGVVVLFPFYLYETFSGRAMPLSWISVGSVLYVGIFPSILSYLFWNKAISELGAARAGQFIHLVPAFGMAMAILFLGEPLRGFHISGFLLILGGVWLATVIARARA